MTENTGNLWLDQWLLHSLKHQCFAQNQLQELARLWRQAPLLSPMVIGISGAQGCGKSTLAKALQSLWAELGVQADIVSLDDYYLDPLQRAERAALWHPLFNERGVPGTHHTEQLLLQLRSFRREEPQCWRRYDKARDRSDTPTTPGNAKLLIFEGWCLGIQPQAEVELERAVNSLEQQEDTKGLWLQQVNQQLATDYQLLWQQIDSLIWLDAPDWQAVCRWRQWQELPLQQQGLGKTSSELAWFMQYFQRLTQVSWQQLPQRSDFTLELDQDHKIVRLIADVEPAPVN